SGAYDEVSVSRSRERYGWGVPVPGDEGQIMYVWADALFNYISGPEIHFGTSASRRMWPADIQIIGKDILKFHAIIWPALLLACGYELPKKLLVHGFINVDGKKMSKSLGNVIAPQQLLERYGVEASRYLIFRGLSFDDDSNFTWADFDHLYNGELANGLGNLVARIIGITKNLDTYSLPELALPTAVEKEFDFRGALGTANQLINRADGIITSEKLWEHSDTKISLIDAAVSHLLEATRILEPFMPNTAVEIRRQLTELDSKPLFPRLRSLLR
ncbi:MAG: class I tRNA ligase family protein, partial [Patescibacteria group bacterium]